jgi:acyl carrier protein
MPDDVRERTIRCFEAVFPDVPHERLSRLSPETDPVWDSLATVTLVAVVEEEFGVELPIDELPQLTSFDRVVDVVRRQSVG